MHISKQIKDTIYKAMSLEIIKLIIIKWKIFQILFMETDK